MEKTIKALELSVAEFIDPIREIKPALKVHKIEIFLASILKFVLFL